MIYITLYPSGLLASRLSLIGLHTLLPELGGRLLQIEQLIQTHNDERVHAHLERFVLECGGLVDTAQVPQRLSHQLHFLINIIKSFDKLHHQLLVGGHDPPRCPGAVGHAALRPDVRSAALHSLLLFLFPALECLFAVLFLAPLVFLEAAFAGAVASAVCALLAD